MSFEKAVKEASETYDEVAELCSGLTKFNSAHPDGSTVECVDYIKKYLDKHGIENEVHARDKNKPNIVAKIKGSVDRTILWAGHLDVVPEGGHDAWRFGPYSGEIAEGHVWGRGTSDMKGACAAAMVAARILNENEGLENSIEFWFTSDEEIGGIEGARWLAESGRIKGDVCVIGDSLGGGTESPGIDLGCKGGAGTRLIARGKTAHGSTPYLGDNAIDKLLKVIPFVMKIGDYKLELPPELAKPIKTTIDFYKENQELDTPEKIKAVERLFDYPSVTCNIFNAGIKTNVVPDYAECAFDIRLTPGSKPLDVKARIEELVAEANVPGVEAIIRASETSGYYESPDSNFAKQLEETVEKLAGKKPIFKILTGGTDAVAIKRFTGIPCLGYGPILGGTAHQPDEKVRIIDMVLSAQVYTGFAYTYRG